MQAISNTVQSSADPFKKLFGGLVLPPTAKLPSLSQAPAGANMSTVNGPVVAKNTGLLSPKVTPAPVATPTKAPVKTAVAPLQKAPVANTVVQNTAPQLGGDNSMGTMNPNYNLQAPGITAPTPTTSRGLFPDVVSSLAQRATYVDPMTSESYRRAQELADTLKQSRLNQATAEAQQHLAPIPIGDATGRQAVTRQQYLDQQAALTGQLQAEQALAGLGITQATAQNSALNSAAGLAQPQVTSYGQTSFNPVTNEFAGGGSLPPEVMRQYAQMAASGQYAAIPSFITSNPVLSAQLNVAAKAINPNFNPIASQAQGQVLSELPALQAAETQAEGIKNTIQSYLQANPTLNPSNLAVGNTLQQWIQGKQLTDPKYQTLFNYLNEYTSTLAPILGVGGDTTNLKTQIAQGFINAAASGQSISQVLEAMSSLAKNKILDRKAGALGGSTTVPAPQSNTGGSTGFAETW